MKPAFVISLDTELVWGSFDKIPALKWAAEYPDVRGVIGDLVRLFERYEVGATWAVVGHLFLDSCQRGADGRPHPEIVRPRHSWREGDWFGDDPCTDRKRDPVWYGDDLIELLLAARVRQEIGSHSFSHIIYGDSGCSPEAARADLKACVEVARTWGISLRSFVFPRNVEGHHELLREHGFVAYRGPDPMWFRGFGHYARRAANLLDQAVALDPPVARPSESLPGLWNIPGSMLLMSHQGLRRLITFAAQLAKAKAGLRRAVEEGGVFHLWSHPFNFARERAPMLRLLEAIIAYAADLRKRGLLDITTMDTVAAQCATEAGISAGTL